MPVMPGSRFAPAQSTSQRVLFVLTALTVLLALFAFGLQWRGGDLVDSARLGELAGDNSRLPGVQDPLNSPLSGRFGTSSDCPKFQPPHIGMFPHHIGWQYAIQKKHSTKVNFDSNTSRSFAQDLAKLLRRELYLWCYYLLLMTPVFHFIWIPFSLISISL